MRITLIGPPDAGKGTRSTGLPPSSLSRTFPAGRPFAKASAPAFDVADYQVPQGGCRRCDDGGGHTQGGHDGGMRQFARMQRTGMTRFARTSHRDFRIAGRGRRRFDRGRLAGGLIYIGFLLEIVDG
jgi:hypothetical protein